MKATSDLPSKNIDVLNSSVNNQGLIGLGLGLLVIIVTSLAVGYQLTGEVSLYAMIFAQQDNLALRLLFLLPFLFAFWGQYAGHLVAQRAGDLIVKETNELRAETTAWKKKYLHDSLHDSLTELPNRIQLFDRLHEAILIAKRESSSLVLLCVDLDNFKEVNEAFGHRQADLILKYVASRLKNVITEGDTVARVAGDEFAVFMLTESPDIAMDIAKRIQDALELPFVIDDNKIEVSCSIGIARFPDDGETTELLMQRTELAMQMAKQDSNGYLIYSADLNQQNPRKVTLLTDLRQALEKDSLELHLQPKIELSTSKVVSAEALLRWEHETHGHVSPEEFVPLAERTRLIKPMTEWVIKSAFQQSERWHQQGLHMGLAINISSRDLNESSLPEYVGRLLKQHEVDPQWFTFEITESSIMSDPKQALSVIKHLSDMGIRLAIDDFGTGYSSLAYLSKLPVQEIKIDKSFVMGMKERKDDATIVRATIDLSHNLGLRVIAEGIEDEETLLQLQEWGCDYGQGYFMSPPLAEKDFTTWLGESRWQLKTGTLG